MKKMLKKIQRFFIHLFGGYSEEETFGNKVVAITRHKIEWCEAICCIDPCFLPENKKSPEYYDRLAEEMSREMVCQLKRCARYSVEYDRGIGAVAVRARVGFCVDVNQGVKENELPDVVMETYEKYT